MTSNRDFKEWLKWTIIVAVVQLSIFYTALAFYHFCVFRKRLAREIEQIKLQHEKLERISKGEPEPELLSPTQLSELLEAEKTQKSDVGTGQKQKKKKKLTKKQTAKSVLKEKIDKKSKPTSVQNVVLPAEKTQMDDVDPVGYQSPYAQQSFTDRGSELHDKKLERAPSDPDQTRTCSLFDEKTVYSPMSAKEPVATPPLPPPPPPEDDIHTAREDFWYE